jgi:hypothetical protein
MAKRYGPNSAKSRQTQVEIEDKRWILPSNYAGFSDKSGRSAKKLKETNRYLQRCVRLLRKYAAEDDGKRFWALADILLCRSNAFMAAVVHKTIKEWYWGMRREKLFSVLADVRKFFSSKQYQNLKIYRFYILKPNGKWRPIGAPGLATKLIHVSLDMILRTKIEQILPEFQHGFRPNRSCATATKVVLDTLRANKEWLVYEFDLKSYFNMVNSTKMFYVFKPFTLEDWKIPMRWIHAVLVGTFPILRDKVWRQEVEVQKLGPTKNPKYKHDKIISGFPQGSPLSPLLSIAVMSFLTGANQPFGKLNNRGKFIMYADDGLVISKKTDVNIKKIFDAADTARSAQFARDFEPSFGDDWHHGIELAEDKHFGKTSKFKFLGVKYDLRFPNNRQAWIDIPAGMYEEFPTGIQLRINIDTATEKELNRFVKYARYVKSKRRHWTWEIQKDSYLWYQYAGLWTGLSAILTWTLNLSGEYYPKGQKLITWLIGWPISSASSIAMSNLLEDLKFLPHYKMKSFKELGSYNYFPKWPIIESGSQVFERTVFMGTWAPQPLI